MDRPSSRFERQRAHDREAALVADSLGLHEDPRWKIAGTIVFWAWLSVEAGVFETAASLILAGAIYCGLKRFIGRARAN